MADTKRYLDYTGLSHYDAKIKEFLKNADDVTLSNAKAYTDEKIGDLGAGLSTVATAIAAEKTLRENSDKAINDVIGVASQAESAEGAGDAVEATGLQKRIEELEAAVGEDGGVADQIDSKIQALDVEEVGGSGKFIQSIKEEDGKIVATAADMPDFAMADDLKALEAIVGTAGTAAVEAKDATIAEGVTLYDAEGNEVSADKIVTGTTYYTDDAQTTQAVAGTDYTESVAAQAAVAGTGLQAQVEAIQEKVGTESVADQIADLDLANTYAAKEYETKVDTLIGDDSGKSARTITNEELAKQLIPENAKESLDTLQEIAAWIQAHPDDASAMNEAIEALKAQVGTKAVAAVTHEATQEDVDAGKATAVGETVVDTPAIAATGIEKEIVDLDNATDARLDALEIAAGLKGDDGDKTVAERVSDIENQLSNADTYTAITEAEVDSLFATSDESET